MRSGNNLKNPEDKKGKKEKGNSKMSSFFLLHYIKQFEYFIKRRYPIATLLVLVI
jgi:hypothetical protein